MATKLYFRKSNALLGNGWIGATSADPAGTNVNGILGLSTSPGGGLATIGTTSTVTGPTSGKCILSSAANPVVFISPPLSAAVTISGTITYNIWGLESSMNANAGLQVLVKRITNLGALGATVSNKEFGTELGTSASANNWTDTAPTSTAFGIGDRILAMICINDAGGTMASGFTVTVDVDGASGGADGDSWLQFNETVSFMSDPAGTSYYLIDTASAVGGAGDKDASQTRGSGSVDSVTAVVTGPNSPIQATDTASGTALEWFTPPLNAFTLSGICKFNVYGFTPAGGVPSATSVAIWAEVAVVNSDGSGASVWGSFGESSANDSTNFFPAINSGGGVDIVNVVYVAGTDTSVTQGQRLRFRVYLDDTTRNINNSGNITVSYNGSSAAAAGDTYVVLPQTVTEQVLTFPTFVQPAFIEIRPNV